MSAGDHLGGQFSGRPELTEDDDEIMRQDITEGEAEGLKNPDRHEKYFR